MEAGVDGIKMFPFEKLGSDALKAWCAVLPADTLIIPVGCITPNSIAPLVATGALGFGIGSALYKAGIPVSGIASSAAIFVAAERAAFSRVVI